MKRPRIVLRRTSDGGWYYRVDGANAEPIVHSETFTEKSSAKDSIKALRRAILLAGVVEDSSHT